MKLKDFGALTFLAALLNGCAITPHTFMSTYEPEQLPKFKGTEGIHTLKGSAFLRQKGGGIVTCAGENVKITRQFEVKRNGYAQEYLSLPYYVRNVTVVDPRLLEFERELAKMTSESAITTQCDVDGKFVFENIDAGVYSALTKVEWYAGQYRQGGYINKLVLIPESKTPRTVTVVIDQ